MTTLTAGRRVRLTTDLRLAGTVVRDGEHGDEESRDDGSPTGAGFLALAEGAEGTVERVRVHEKRQGDAAREYERLKALLDDYGPQMPPESRGRLVERVASLEPEWTAFQRERTRVTVRVRFDNGFVLDEAPEGVVAPV